jgi:hypothetical protein
MPRKAPTQIIEHRLSLQDAERDALLKPTAAILTNIEQFSETANTLRQVAVYGAVGLGVGALYILPKVWSTTSRLIGGVMDNFEDVDDFLQSPVKNTFEKISEEAKDFTGWLFGIDVGDLNWGPATN